MTVEHSAAFAPLGRPQSTGTAKPTPIGGVKTVDPSHAINYPKIWEYCQQADEYLDLVSSDLVMDKRYVLESVSALQCTMLHYLRVEMPIEDEGLRQCMIKLVNRAGQLRTKLMAPRAGSPGRNVNA